MTRANRRPLLSRPEGLAAAVRDLKIGEATGLIEVMTAADYSPQALRVAKRRMRSSTGVATRRASEAGAGFYSIAVVHRMHDDCDRIFVIAIVTRVEADPETGEADCSV